MKVEFDYKEIVDKVKNLKSFFLGVLIFTFIALVGFSLFTILNLEDDPAVVSEYNKKEQELNIIFDKKYLQELKEKRSPSVVNEAGGRNPFMPF